MATEHAQSGDETPVDVDMRQKMAEEIELLEKLKLEKARTSLLAFAKYCIPGFEINWHHRVIARYLTDFAYGRIPRLVVTLPPGAGKSTLCSIALPAFLFGLSRDSRVLTASYNQSLSTKFSRQVQRLMDSEEYKRVFPETELPGTERTRGKTSYTRTQSEFEIIGGKGFYKASSVGGTATGIRLSHAIVDDPIKSRLDASSETYRQNVWDWYTSTLLTRLDKGGALLIILTRWHADDLAGRVIEVGKEDPDAEKFTVVNFPAIAEEEGELDDPRKVGEALWASRFPIAKLKQTRKTIGERDFISLYQQRPAPADGDILKLDWFKYWRELPEHFSYKAIACDLGFKDDKARGDFSVLQVWGLHKGDFYLIAQTRDRMGWTQQKRVLPRMAQVHRPDAVFVETAANGDALVAEVKQLGVPGVIGVDPKGSKRTRFEAVSALVESGNVYLPDPKMTGFEWVEQKFLPELLGFPSQKFDDQVDAFTLALSQMRKRSFNFQIVGGLAVDKSEDNPLQFLNLYVS